MSFSFSLNSFNSLNSFDSFLFYSSIFIIKFINYKKKLNKNNLIINKQTMSSSSTSSHSSSSSTSECLFYKRNDILFSNSQQNNRESESESDINCWKLIKSESNENKKCQLKVINNLNYYVIFCWIGFDGKLFHYRRLNDKSIQDGSVNNYLIEYSTIYHSFVCFFLPPSIDINNIKRLEDLNPEVIFLFSHSNY